MRKFVSMILIALFVVTMFVGCCNRRSPVYEKVHVVTHDYSGCFTVEKWYDKLSGIEVLTKEYGTMYLPNGTYILIEKDDNCPFCGMR